MSDVKKLLDQKVLEYNRLEFIKHDPISIPHLFTSKQDIEIAGLFAAIFAWGNRTIIIKKSMELMQLMDMAPHDFILHHQDSDLKALLNFKHRTFNSSDLLYFIEWLRLHYMSNDSLETAFLTQSGRVEEGLTQFYDLFFSLEDAPDRTKKHIATPAKKSTCKRLNMFLRWMVRKDENGVDFGIWNRLHAKNLIIPIDIHVARTAKHLQLLATDTKINWEAAIALTSQLVKLDPTDPVKYDFALFGMSVFQKNSL